jgi:hypothetical protein
MRGGDKGSGQARREKGTNRQCTGIAIKVIAYTLIELGRFYASYRCRHFILKLSKSKVATLSSRMFDVIHSPHMALSDTMGRFPT